MLPPSERLDLSDEELAVRKKFGGDGFYLQLRKLGFTEDQSAKTIRMLAEMNRKRPTFFAKKNAKVLASAWAYAVYSYLKASRLMSLQINQRLVASLAPGGEVNPESVSHLYRRIINEFRADFPTFFGGSWDRNFLQQVAHKHIWVTEGPAYEELQSMTNEEYRTKRGVSWSGKRLDLYRKMQEQHCSSCGKSRRFLKYDDDRSSEYSCPNPQCPDYGVKGRGNIKIEKFYGKRKVASLACVTCKKRFSDTLGTPFYDMRIAPEKLLKMLRMISEGRRILATAAEAQVTRNTVERVLHLARSNRTQFDQIMVRDLGLTQHQIEDFWKNAERGARSRVSTHGRGAELL